MHVSIDDFGTGHSSLATLRRLPAQELKIDRASWPTWSTMPTPGPIVEAMLAMARTLGLRVVAEGVETDRAARSCSMQMGCDELQGYLFAKPMTRAIAVEAWIAPASAGCRPSSRR